MKKIILLFIISFIVTSCQKGLEKIEKVTGFAGGYSESTVEGVQSLVSYTSVFTQVGVVAIGMAVLAFILSPVLKKWMHGVH